MTLLLCKYCDEPGERGYDLFRHGTEFAHARCIFYRSEFSLVTIGPRARARFIAALRRDGLGDRVDAICRTWPFSKLIGKEKPDEDLTD